ncbi:hypothetical protein QBC38DRAFT_269905 [Podospora fimiseda]|uniref:Protein kinase domain-containing protein n=1 Tax=Podospora fimiseda TaxID=252190 RepID=A0AAN7BKV7_9PEZI|nr:hypothetical protein QBC38DRAFT_269905 [Podospora fimiseda]
MESYLPMSGTQPAVHRRLSRLYNDTKRKSDFVTTEPTQNVEADPEIRSLHRKLRIQKDRFVAWGLEWSDPSQSAAEVLIDSSLSKAGISELVTGIMKNINETLAEAEPLWMSARRLLGEVEPPAQVARRGEKIQMVVWDKNKFQDLIADLTTSIDTLYDLSRTRSSASHSAAMSKHSAAPEDLRPFESSRFQTPRQIDPKTLKNLRAMQAVPMTEVAETPRSHEIVFMDRQAYAELTSTSSGTRQPHAPLLLEYATFDSIYSITGISPPMARFEKLSAALQAEPQRAPGSWTGLPRLLGYFEDMDDSRFGLVYQFPRTFNPVTYEHLTQNPLYNLCTLKDLLTRRDFEPKLEAKFRLAANLVNTVFDMHARGITHGNIGDDTVSFCNAVGTDPEVSGISQGEVDIRRPLISSFDLFTDTDSADPQRPFSLYKHQLDPRNNPQSPFKSKADSKTFDLYSLAMVLLSIGLWTKLEDLVPNMDFPSIPESIINQLTIRCGTLYAKVVQVCWNAVEQEMGGPEPTEEKEVVRRVQLRASRYLEACCILDGVSTLEERLGDDLGDVRPQSTRLSMASGSGPSQETKSEKRSSSVSAAPVGAKPEQRHPLIKAQVQSHPKAKVSASDPVETAAPPKQKVRLFPHVPLPLEIVDRWNTYIMPQVNMALRSFYRKNPESVEISLESIGETAQRTKPTVLVVCTSVGKVKAILKKKLGDLFDGTQGVGLKVCSGRMLRSRKESAMRSMEGDGEDVVAANPGYQPQPINGASIGAWIGYQHLPPVSLGGILTVDNRLYGMTVHHMLDDPALDAQEGKQGEPRSMADSQPIMDLHAWYAQRYQTTSDTEPESSGTEDYACEFSDSDAYSESAITSDYSDDSEDEDEDCDDESEPGDKVGIEPGTGEGFIITQPALDDMPDGHYVDPENQDEEHLLSCTLGQMYASSGIRRRTENGMVHEIDWALFEFHDERLPPGNIIPFVGGPSSPIATLQPAESRIPTSNVSPTNIVPSSSLPGLEVQCMARTSGLQTGLILPAIASVKMYGRTSPSQTYQVSGSPPPPESVPHEKQSSLPMGIPGDSGAWVIDRDQGRVCGHILAFSQRKRIAYICPMDVMIHDIAETLEADEIRLPGGEVVYLREGTFRGGDLGIGRSLTHRSGVSEDSTGTGLQGSEGGEAGDDENDDPPTLASRFGSFKRRSQRSSVTTPTVKDRFSYLSARRESHQGLVGAQANTVNEEKEEEFDSAIEVDKGLARRLRQMEIEMAGTQQQSGQMSEEELIARWRGYS